MFARNVTVPFKFSAGEKRTYDISFFLKYNNGEESRKNISVLSECTEVSAERAVMKYTFVLDEDFIEEFESSFTPSFSDPELDSEMDMSKLDGAKNSLLAMLTDGVCISFDAAGNYETFLALEEIDSVVIPSFFSFMTDFVREEVSGNLDADYFMEIFSKGFARLSDSFFDGLFFNLFSCRGISYKLKKKTACSRSCYFMFEDAVVTIDGERKVTQDKRKNICIEENYFYSREFLVSSAKKLVSVFMARLKTKEAYDIFHGMIVSANGGKEINYISYLSAMAVISRYMDSYLTEVIENAVDNSEAAGKKQKINYIFDGRSGVLLQFNFLQTRNVPELSAAAPADVEPEDDDVYYVENDVEKKLKEFSIEIKLSE